MTKSKKFKPRKVKKQKGWKPESKRTFEEHVFLTLMGYGRELILKEYNANSAIICAGVAYDVCNYFSIPTVTMCTVATVWNPAGRKAMEKEGRFLTDEEILATDKLPPEQRVWCVSIGNPDGIDDPVGHPLAVCDGEVICDLALDQASRPQHSMHLSPLLLRVPNMKEVLDHKQVAVGTQHGCLITYKKLENVRYMDSKNWRLRERAHVAFRIIEEIKKHEYLSGLSQSPRHQRS